VCLPIGRSLAKPDTKIIHTVCSAAALRDPNVGFGVKNRGARVRAARPFYSQEQISSACPGMSVWCQNQKSSTAWVMFR
jgi:hypothetical protein